MNWFDHYTTKDNWEVESLSLPSMGVSFWREMRGDEFEISKFVWLFEIRNSFEMLIIFHFRIRSWNTSSRVDRLHSLAF